MVPRDYTLDLPDECLSLIFHSLSQSDRNRCSLVCHRWLKIEGQNRNRLSLHAQATLSSHLQSILSRFDSVTKLALRNDRRSDSITDESLVFISVKLPRLSRIKLRSCKQITGQGIVSMASNCKFLKKISCASCLLGPTELKSVLLFCPLLEDVSLKRLRGVVESTQELASSCCNDYSYHSSLRSICLKDLYNAQCFIPVLAECKKLKCVKIFRCSGAWDGSLEEISSRVNSLTEIHLEKLQVSDRGLYALSRCTDLEILHLAKTPECTDAGVAEIASNCHSLRKLHIDGWRTHRIGDLGLLAVSKNCPNLQELVLIGVNLTVLSLGSIAASCSQLERLAMCGCETVGDRELASLGSRCTKLRKLCIKGCNVSDRGLEALAEGCPSLVKVKLKRCGGVTVEGINWLRLVRGEGFAISLDVPEMVQEQDQDQDGAGPNETVAQNSNPNPNPNPFHISELVDSMAAMDLPSSSNAMPVQNPNPNPNPNPNSNPKSRVRTLMQLAMRRWSGGSGGPAGGSGAAPTT